MRQGKMPRNKMKLPPIPEGSLRTRLREIIFESDTVAGQWFDIGLIVAILLSVLAVMLDSVESIQKQFGTSLHIIEWVFTGLFTIEYLMRLATIGNPTQYARSFWGITDLLGILPTYISLLVPGGQYLAVLRIIRVLRVFRVLRLIRYLGEATVLIQALRASRRKVFVFLLTVISLAVIFGSFMYVIEHKNSGFTSIPQSIYWSIVTLTTVGYGNIVPETVLGQFVASIIMVLGYSIIAVPTGIVTVELSQALDKNPSIAVCGECSAEGHDVDAVHCKYCGTRLPDEP